MTDKYYTSGEYVDAVNAASKDASHDGNPADRFPNLPIEEWDKRFVAALLERGLKIKRMNHDGSSDFPMTAPLPCTGGYPYPSFIVKVAD